MTSRYHILEVCPQRGPGRYVLNENLEDMPEGLEGMPEGLEETSVVRDFQPLSDNNRTNPSTQRRIRPHSRRLPAVQLLFRGLTVTPLPYRPVNQPPYHQRWPKCLNPTALELDSNGVVGTLRLELDQAQTIIKVVFKFLIILMPNLTNNTHVTAYLVCRRKTQRNPKIDRKKNLLTKDLIESGLYVFIINIKNYLIRLQDKALTF